MKPISGAALRKALVLANAEGMPNDAMTPDGPYTGPLVTALARHLDEVSELAKGLLPYTLPGTMPSMRQREQLQALVLPDEQDELKREIKLALAETYGGCAPEFESAFHEQLAKRGLQITKVHP